LVNGVAMVSIGFKHGWLMVLLLVNGNYPLVIAWYYLLVGEKNGDDNNNALIT